MRVFHFTEQPYPAAWGPEHPSLRVDIPSRACDPTIMAGLYHRYLDEWMLADELGFDIMVNEHHATATCLSVAPGLTLAALARQTTRARLLTLGYPIANRLDPVRIAEELAMIDVLSHGRLEMGFVRGVSYEAVSAVRSAVGMMDRFWEAHDLILKAMTHHDGPFDWQGEHFQYRNVNVWPRPYQAPHPPIWIPARSPANVRDVALRGYVLASFFTGFKTRDVFDHYRRTCAEEGLPSPGPDRFAYLGLIAVGETHTEAMRRAGALMRYVETLPRITPPFAAPAGFNLVAESVRALKTGGAGLAGAKGAPTTIEDSVKGGFMFVGTPDEVYRQISHFSDAVGGLGNLLMMGQAADLSHDDTVANLTLFANEVMPRLKQDAGRAAA